MNPLYFNLLKYVHSPFLGEEVNVGVLLYFPAQERMEFRFPESLRRVRALYPTLSERQLRTYLTSFAARVRQANAELKTAPSVEQYAAFIVRELLPPNATVLQFGACTKAIAHTADPVAAADHYYELFFGAVTPAAVPVRKDDDFLFRQFRSVLSRTDPAATKLLQRDVEVVSDKTSVRFDAAWKNGALNHVKAVSFDLNNAASINQKSVYCHGWLDLLADEAKAHNYQFDLLLAPPSQPALRSEYNRAIHILQDTTAPVRLIAEGEELVAYSEQAAQHLLAGG